MEESIRKIQSQGIMIVSGMVVGFDTDDLSIFENQKQFITRTGLTAPMLGMLMAPVGTKLWDRMKQEGRLIGPDSGDASTRTNIIPKLMTTEELEQNYLQLIKSVYSMDFYRKTAQAFIDQIDVHAIKKDSYIINFFKFRKTPIFYLIYGLKITKTYLFSGKDDRLFYFEVMMMAIRKSIFCIPIAFSILVYFRALNSFGTRVITPDLGKTAPSSDCNC